MKKIILRQVKISLCEVRLMLTGRFVSIKLGVRVRTGFTLYKDILTRAPGVPTSQSGHT